MSPRRNPTGCKTAKTAKSAENHRNLVQDLNPDWDYARVLTLMNILSVQALARMMQPYSGSRGPESRLIRKDGGRGEKHRFYTHLRERRVVENEGLTCKDWGRRRKTPPLEKEPAHPVTLGAEHTPSNNIERS